MIVLVNGRDLGPLGNPRDLVADRPLRRLDFPPAASRVTISLAISLAAAHVPHPATIGCAAGAAALVITGPLVNRYVRRLMLRQARQPGTGAPQAAATP